MPNHRINLVEWPEAWYPIARSVDLRLGGISSGEIAGFAYVAYRDMNGQLAAVDAHCPHMGTHLKHSTVQGDALVCPLHNWKIKAGKSCSGATEAANYRARSWSIAERFGIIFLYPGEDHAPALPSPDNPDYFQWTTTKPVELRTSWHAMMINAFDLSHFVAVHQRELIEPCDITRLDSALRLRYVSRVTKGSGLSGWMMRWISKDRIKVQQTCHGPTIIIESDLGRAKTVAVLGLFNLGGKVRAFGAFGTSRKSIFRYPKLLITRWLFLRFLKKDFAVLEDMRLTIEGVEDEGVKSISTFLASLPKVSRVS